MNMWKQEQQKVMGEEETIGVAGYLSEETMMEAADMRSRISPADECFNVSENLISFLNFFPSLRYTVKDFFNFLVSENAPKCFRLAVGREPL